jgi:hypothetical protein
MKRWFTFAALLVLPSFTAQAHWASPGYLELKQSDEYTYAILWKIPLQAGKPMAISPALPDGCIEQTPIKSINTAAAVVQRWVARCEYGLTGKSIVIDGLTATLTDVLARVNRLDGSVQTVRLTGSEPFFVVTDSQDWLDVSRTYLALGFHHILAGTDHLLFVAALLIIVAGWRRLIATITAFTIAHSITLAMATLGWLHLPFQPIEAVIALSIVFLAVEIVRHNRSIHLNTAPGVSLTYKWPWVVAFTFGLLHGFGFAGALIEVGLPQNAIPLALLFFNIGVELGQLMFVGAFLLLTAVAGRLSMPRTKWIEVPAAYAIGAVAAYWTTQRVIGFWAYQI